MIAAEGHDWPNISFWELADSPCQHVVCAGSVDEPSQIICCFESSAKRSMGLGLRGTDETLQASMDVPQL